MVWLECCLITLPLMFTRTRANKPDVRNLLSLAILLYKWAFLWTLFTYCHMELTIFAVNFLPSDHKISLSFGTPGESCSHAKLDTVLLLLESFAATLWPIVYIWNNADLRLVTITTLALDSVQRCLFLSIRWRKDTSSHLNVNRVLKGASALVS